MFVYCRIPAGIGLVLLVGCSSAPPPPAVPAPEPEPEEVAGEPEAPRVLQIPIEERIRAPFAVLSDGRPAPREARHGVVVLEQPPAGRTPAAGGNGADPPTAPAAGGAAASRAPAPRQHTVEAGETFYAVARRYQVTPSALAAVNPGIDVDRLRPGQVLQLPAYASRGDPRSGSAPSAPATPSRSSTPPPAAPQPAQPRTHTVASGETLWGIARRYNVTPEQIRRANRMNDDVVRVGQRLVIPNR